MKNRIKIKARSIGIFLLYFSFIFLSAYIFYLYSQKSELVFWGNKSRDGLYFLVFFYLLLPLLLLLSILKIVLYKVNNYIRFSFLFYTLLVALPATVSIKSQISLSIGMLFCVIACILIIVEYIAIIHNRVFYRQ